MRPFSFTMACKCRTRVFVHDYNKTLVEALKWLNSIAKYYFVLYENNEVLLERASLIEGTTEEIKKEKVFLICELIKLKERL